MPTASREAADADSTGPLSKANEVVAVIVAFKLTDFRPHMATL
jgi:hypothetical protein